MSDMDCVLIVDDDTRWCLSLFDCWETVVETAWSGQAALDMTKTTKYGAIVLGFKIAGLNDLEGVQKLQQLRPETPMLLMTDDDQMAMDAIQKGIYG